MTAAPVDTAASFGLLMDSLPELMPIWIEQSKTKGDMASQLIKLMEPMIRRAQQGQADTLLQKVLAIRRVGSPMQQQIWRQACEAARRQGLEIPS